MSAAQPRNSRGSVKHRRLEVITTGSSGSATGSVSLHTGPAVIRFIAVDYHASAPGATTDLTVKSRGRVGEADETLLTLTNTATDVSLRPITMTAGVDEGNAPIAATDGTAGGMPVREGILIEMAQTDALSPAAVVDIFYEECELIQARLFPAGADGSAAASQLCRLKSAGAGIVRAIAIDFGAGVPASQDLTIKRDVAGDLTGGVQIFTVGGTGINVDVPVAPVGMAAGNETNLATAATDATDGGWPFKSNLFIEIAQGDGYATNEDTRVDLWVDA
jgi:hypothetical protein